MALLIQFTCYLRPGELLHLGPNHMVPPTAGAGEYALQWSFILEATETGKPAKVGEFDESVVLDWKSFR